MAPRSASNALGNLGVLLWSHLAGLAAAFAMVPYLARVLRPEGWGPVLVAQALAAWLVLLIEYAFDLSVTRQLAEVRARDGAGSESLHELVSDALSARVLLAAGAVVVWAGSCLLVPVLREHALLAGGVLLLALARGLTPLWFYLGMERVRGAVMLESVARVVGLLAPFVLVQQPSHGWRVVAAQAVTATVVMVVLTYRLRAALLWRPVVWSWRGARRVLAQGGTLFAARASGALYMQLNAVLIGVVASPAAVALFGGSERLVRAAVGLLEPLTRALVPRLAYVRGHHPAEANRLAQRLMIGLTVAATLAAAVCAAAAPAVIALLLGPGYEAAVPVFRVLLLLLPLITLATTIGIFAAVPRGRDRVVLLGTVVAGVTNLLLGVPLTRRIGVTGMATSVVIAEGLVAVILLVWYLREGPLVGEGAGVEVTP